MYGIGNQVSCFQDAVNLLGTRFLNKPLGYEHDGTDMLFRCLSILGFVWMVLCAVRASFRTVHPFMQMGTGNGQLSQKQLSQKKECNRFPSVSVKDTSEIGEADGSILHDCERDVCTMKIGRQ